MPRKKQQTARELVPIELLTGELVPSEKWECSRFVAWLDRQPEVVLYSHIANERQSTRERRLAWRLGTRAGVPDYAIVLAGGQVVWIEMKRAKGASSTLSKPTKEQLEWIAALQPHAAVCYGSDSAIRFVSRYFTEAA